MSGPLAGGTPRAIGLFLGKVLLEPGLGLQLSVQGGDGNAKRITRTARPCGLSHLMRAQDDVLQGAYLHQQPPYDRVVAVAVADDTELGA